jgi:hypothetical protein
MGMNVIAYTGVILVAVSYLFNIKKMLQIQLAATAFLLAYSVWMQSIPYVILQVFCGVLISVKLTKGVD